jgi:hypothetical protein
MLLSKKASAFCIENLIVKQEEKLKIKNINSDNLKNDYFNISNGKSLSDQFTSSLSYGGLSSTSSSSNSSFILNDYHNSNKNPAFIGNSFRLNFN